MVYGKSPPSRPMTPEPPTGTGAATAGAGGGTATEGTAVSEPFFVDFPKGERGTVFFSGTAGGGFCGVSWTTGGAGFSIFATGSVCLIAGADSTAARATGARRISVGACGRP